MLAVSGCTDFQAGVGAYNRGDYETASGFPPPRIPHNPLILKDGGPCRDRTWVPLIKSQLLAIFAWA